MKSIKKNYIYNLIYQILILILPLVTTPYLSRVLGAENIGIYSYTLSITTYFILFGSLGIAMYGQREIAYVQNDKNKRSKIFFEVLVLRFITLGIALLIFYLTFCIKGDYSIYYRILILELLANSVDISWFFQGLEEFKKTVARNILVKIISVVCIFVFVKTGENLLQYFIIYVLSTFLGNITLWFYLPKFINKIKIKELNPFRHFKATLSLFVPQIAIQIYTVLDKVMIGAIVTDKSEVGYYEQAQKIIKLLLTIATSLNTVMIPRMANIYANGNITKMKEYLYKSFSFTFILIFPIIFGIISVSDKFVPVFFGKGYEKVSILMNITSLILLAMGASSIIGHQYLLPTKKQKEFTISVTIGAIINFVLNIIFINLWKSIGASIVTVIAEFSVTIVQIILVRKTINFGKVINTGKNYLIASVIMFFVSIFVGSMIESNKLSVILQCISGSVTYFAILFIMKDKLINEGIELIKQKLRKEEI